MRIARHPEGDGRASVECSIMRESEVIEVERSEPDERLDVYLRGRFPDVSRGTIQRLIYAGAIRVNGRHVRSTASPRVGDRIEVTWPPPIASTALPQDIPLQVLYEDDDLLVINKAAGLVVHPAAGHDDGTLVNALLHHCAGNLSGIGGVVRPGIVHRLDKDTSGCLVVAKHDRAHVALAEQFAERDLEKVYLAVVCGILKPDQGEIRAAIARHPSHRKRMAVQTGGRDAWTSIRVRERFPVGATWVEATLHTGRTHQIRVHLQHIGFPLVGDETYGRKANIRLAEATGFAAARQLLHAWKITFRHPGTEQPVSFEAPIPEDLKAAIAALRAAGGEKA